MAINGIKESPHWYDSAGTPMHAADLRLARKLNLFPSVTTVLGVWPNFAIDNYRIEQAVQAALDLKMVQTETEDEYWNRFSRETIATPASKGAGWFHKHPPLSKLPDNWEELIATGMNAHREKAALFGRELHNINERIITGRTQLHELQDAQVDGRGIYEFAERMDDFFRKEIKRVYSVETVVVNPEYGYAGTYDLIAETRSWGVCLIDYKTQGIKVPAGAKKGKPNFYESWRYQLAAYAYALGPAGDIVDNHLSIVINSAVPEPPHVKVWEPDGGVAFRKFRAALRLWKESKSYYPGEIRP